jgi:hypothetical protein
VDKQRYEELDKSGEGLTDDEWENGWHWCDEWDGLLVGPGMTEALACSCNHPRIETWKKSQEALDTIARLDEELGLQ